MPADDCDGLNPPTTVRILIVRQNDYSIASPYRYDKKTAPAGRHSSVPRRVMGLLPS